MSLGWRRPRSCRGVSWLAVRYRSWRPNTHLRLRRLARARRPRCRAATGSPGELRRGDHWCRRFRFRSGPGDRRQAGLPFDTDPGRRLRRFRWTRHRLENPIDDPIANPGRWRWHRWLERECTADPNTRHHDRSRGQYPESHAYQGTGATLARRPSTCRTRSSAMATSSGVPARFRNRAICSASSSTSSRVTRSDGSVPSVMSMPLL